MVAFVDAIGDIPNNKKIETKLTEAFMRGRKLDIFFIQNHFLLFFSYGHALLLKAFDIIAL